MERLLEFLPQRAWPISLRYLATVGIMLVATALQLGLNLQANFDGLFLLLPGVFLAGVLFDRGSAFLAASCATVVASFWILPRTTAEFLLPSTLFAITVFGVAAVSEALRREVIKVVNAERAKSGLLRELAHRTKNNLAVLSAMVRLQARAAEPSAAAALEDTARRIRVLAEVYDHLTLREDTKFVNMRDYLTDVCQKIAGALGGAGPVAITVRSDELLISSQQAVPLAIIANELVTNSLKHAFPNERPGLISVEFQTTGNRMELTVSDNGVGMEGDQPAGGLGSRINAMLAQQLNGTLSYEKLETGHRVKLSAELPRQSLFSEAGDGAARQPTMTAS